MLVNYPKVTRPDIETLAVLFFQESRAMGIYASSDSWFGIGEAARQAFRGMADGQLELPIDGEAERAKAEKLVRR